MTLRQAGVERFATDFGNAQFSPFRYGLAYSHVGQTVIELTRYGYLHAPGLTGLPVRGTEVVGGRAQRIGARLPDVPAAVTIEIDGITVVRAWDELRLPHGASPGADHFVGLDVAVSNNVQCSEEFVTGKVRTTSLVGERGQRAHDVAVANIVTEVAFQPPDSH